MSLFFCSWGFKSADFVKICGASRNKSLASVVIWSTRRIHPITRKRPVKLVELAGLGLLLVSSQVRISGLSQSTQNFVDGPRESLLFTQGSDEVFFHHRIEAFELEFEVEELALFFEVVFGSVKLEIHLVRAEVLFEFVHVVVQHF